LISRSVSGAALAVALETPKKRLRAKALSACATMISHLCKGEGHSLTFEQDDTVK